MSSEHSPSYSSSKSVRGPRPRLFSKNACQADDCAADLKKLPFYNRRNHICGAHKTAPQFSRLGQLVRFCQRCGLSHPLRNFDAEKRSCRMKLQKHNARRRKTTSSAEELSLESPLQPHSLSGELEEAVVPAPSAGPLPALSAANSAAGDERVCCVAAAAERLCSRICDANAATSPAPDAAVALAAGGMGPAAADHDSDAVKGNAPQQAAAAAAEAELAALRATDAAVYAVVVHHQLMQARLLLATCGMVARQTMHPPLPLWVGK